MTPKPNWDDWFVDSPDKQAWIEMVTSKPKRDINWWLNQTLASIPFVLSGVWLVIGAAAGNLIGAIILLFFFWMAGAIIIGFLMTGHFPGE